jgi:hypothetical protein
MLPPALATALPSSFPPHLKFSPYPAKRFCLMGLRC